MKAILKAHLQRDLKMALLPISDKLTPLFSGRVMVSTLPEQYQEWPDGQVLPLQHEIANDPRLQKFYRHERVIYAAGGIGGMEAWTHELTECQYSSAEHSDWLVTRRYDGKAIRLCEACDNRTRDFETPKLQAIADSNAAMFVVEAVKWRLRSEGQLTLPELVLWAMMYGLTDLLPDVIAADLLELPRPKIIHGNTRESDITPGPTPREILAGKVVKKFTVDPEPPKAFMLRPKLTRVEDSKYTRWVKTRPCCGCGARADDPHHIIGHGLGGMGTKAHDYLTIPLCRACHRKLHDDPVAWEEEHGSQTDLLVQFLDFNFGTGALS
ncbi:MAG: DUF968 domain-containing protein [Hafnia alvei]